jgi:hypothetical protein
VPAYAANFRNVPLISYSGEIDGQRASAEYMTEVLAKEGLTRPHLIGVGMGHKYHPETIKEVQQWIEAAVAKGRDPWPKKVTLQTRSLRYATQFWLSLTQFGQEWVDARIDAEILDAEKMIRLTTHNVTSLIVRRQPATQSYRVLINGQPAEGPGAYGYTFRDSHWVSASKGESEGGAWPTIKSADQCGPIETAFLDRFLVVLPDRPGTHPQVDAWVASESKHFLDRWRRLMRGDPKIVPAAALTDSMPGTRILWGDPSSNSQIAKIADHLAVQWKGDTLTLGTQTWSAATHVPTLIQGWGKKEPLTVVLNSGLTFREAHDKTNSLQNPKLPDWAILDITQHPTTQAAGKVVAADFFDSYWQVLPRVKSPQTQGGF